MTEELWATVINRVFNLRTAAVAFGFALVFFGQQSGLSPEERKELVILIVGYIISYGMQKDETPKAKQKRLAEEALAVEQPEAVLAAMDAKKN